MNEDKRGEVVATFVITFLILVVGIFLYRFGGFGDRPDTGELTYPDSLARINADTEKAFWESVENAAKLKTAKLDYLYSQLSEKEKCRVEQPILFPDYYADGEWSRDLFSTTVAVNT